MPVEYHYDLCQWKFHSVNARVEPGNLVYKCFIGKVSEARCTSLLHKFSHDGRVRAINAYSLREHFKSTVSV